MRSLQLAAFHWNGKSDWYVLLKLEFLGLVLMNIGFHGRSSGCHCCYSMGPIPQQRRGLSACGRRNTYIIGTHTSIRNRLLRWYRIHSSRHGIQLHKYLHLESHRQQSKHRPLRSLPAMAINLPGRVLPP